jgi:hypothetical protein
MAHQDKTLLGDRVLYFRKGNPSGHVAFVYQVHSDHCASLVFYCPVTHSWKEATSITFGKNDTADYFVNPEG